MGITQLSLNRINRYLKPESKILIIGCQNCYWTENYGEIAHTYFKALGHDVKSIDILGCNGSDVADLRVDLGFKSEFNQVWNHGTIEHCDSNLYQVIKNIHEACTIGGFMIHENPKTGNWPKHGTYYFTKDFWAVLADRCIYEIHDIQDEAAMSNTIDGWNVCCVLRKTHDSKFLTEKQFNKIYNEHIFKS